MIGTPGSKGHVFARAVGAVIVSVAVFLAGPVAFAKAFGVARVILTGPRLDRALSLSAQEFGIPSSDRDPSAVAVEGLLGPKRERRPTGGLGPRYRLAYELDLGLFPKPRSAVVEQYLSPYADGGAVTFTPPGQRVRLFPSANQHRIPSGWLAFPEEILRRFQAQGFLHSHSGRLGTAREAQGQGGDQQADEPSSREPVETSATGAYPWLPIILLTAVGAAGLWLSNMRSAWRVPGGTRQEVSRRRPWRGLRGGGAEGKAAR